MTTSLGERPKASCAGCGRAPAQILEYSPEFTGEDISAEDYVWQEEGTLDRNTGLFLCTDCYIKYGMPVASGGWKATRHNLLRLWGIE